MYQTEMYRLYREMTFFFLFNVYNYVWIAIIYRLYGKMTSNGHFSL